MRPTPFQAFVRIRSAATSSAPTASCPASAAPSRAGRPSTSSPRSAQLADRGLQGDHAARPDRQQLQVRRRRRPHDAAVRPAGTHPRHRRASSGSSSSRTSRKDMTDDLLEAVRDLPKVCPYLHVPAQSGLQRGAQADEAAVHGRVLPRHAGPHAARRCRAWRSPATSSSASAARPRSRSRRPCDLVARGRFKNSFIFKYSPRPGTKGARAVRRRRARGSQEAPQQRPARDPERGQPGRTTARCIGQTRRGAGRRAEQERRSSTTAPAARAAHRPDADGPHRRLRRQPAADRRGRCDVDIDEATAFTLFGTVVTGEQVGVERDSCESRADAMPAAD